MIRYLQKLMNIVNLCEEFKKYCIDFAFIDPKTKNILEDARNYFYCWTPRYQEFLRVISGIVDMCDMLGIELLEEYKSEMMKRVTFLINPEAIQKRGFFEVHFDFILSTFKNSEDEIINKLQLLDQEEMSRLDEALNCYLQGCNYSAITMAVSAIEFRLFSLMMLQCPDPKLDELTLGQLIREYLNDKRKYGMAIPKKHEPLLEHCNVYRIFSVHPKREKITKSIATSIINMTFAFLLDEDLKHKAEVK